MGEGGVGKLARRARPLARPGMMLEDEETGRKDEKEKQKKKKRRGREGEGEGGTKNCERRGRSQSIPGTAAQETTPVVR